MNMSTSECSSGCESGWTAYLDQSSNSAFDICNKAERRYRVTLQEEYRDEDLSMVSDASSGPRHDTNHEQNDNNCFPNYSCSVSASKQGMIRKESKIRENKGKFIEDCCLDDTASSPVFSFSKKKMALSTDQAFPEQETQGFSTTHYQGKSSNQHLGFQNSSVTGRKKSGDFHGRNYKWQ